MVVFYGNNCVYCRHVEEATVTLPSRDSLKIVVKGLDKKAYEVLKKQITHDKPGQLINLEKVHRALTYLKANNKFVFYRTL